MLRKIGQWFLEFIVQWLPWTSADMLTDRKQRRKLISSIAWTGATLMSWVSAAIAHLRALDPVWLAYIGGVSTTALVAAAIPIVSLAREKRRLQDARLHPTPLTLSLIGTQESWFEAGYFKLKSHVEVENTTGQTIRVLPPNKWDACEASLQGSPTKTLAAAKFQRWDASKWNWTKEEFIGLDEVQPGDRFRFYLGFEPTIGLDALRTSRGKKRLGTFTLPVFIGGRYHEWTQSL